MGNSVKLEHAPEARVAKSTYFKRLEGKGRKTPKIKKNGGSKSYQIYVCNCEVFGHFWSRVAPDPFEGPKHVKHEDLTSPPPRVA